MHHQHEAKQELGPDEHIDPVCGMTVGEGPGAITFDYKGAKYYFCSPGCRRAFEKDPEKFLRGGPQSHM
ncbi:MAG: YHS domain-containing protein [Chloroflexi bacterium]|nr:YHS domain-containing protein [Chloroflexota bacterium]